VIVVDTSAIVAAILNEPSHKSIAPKLAGADEKVCSAMSAVECVMVMSRTYSDPRTVLETYLRRVGIDVCSVDETHMKHAIEGFLLYGKGRHRARLNLGDCFSYAAAKALDAPLLYVGNDFPRTDVRAA
jgi:ribonuclease VapC